jgi:3-hydroxyisobutyrate dehydrogenase-like beta-hydroxyacid dehydrogenase
MGALIVPRLLDAGHNVTGWNRTRDKAKTLIDAGMHYAETPRAVAAAADIVFSIVTDAAAVRAVALGPDGIVAGLRMGGIYIDMSTIGRMQAARSPPNAQEPVRSCWTGRCPAARSRSKLAKLRS